MQQQTVDVGGRGCSRGTARGNHGRCGVQQRQERTGPATVIVLMGSVNGDNGRSAARSR